VTVGPDHVACVFYYSDFGGNHIRMRKSSEAFGVIHEVSGLLNNTAANGELGLYGSFRSRLSPKPSSAPSLPV